VKFKVEFHECLLLNLISFFTSSTYTFKQTSIISLEFRLLNEVVVTTPTIGSNVEEIRYKNIHFLMWDIGGQESLRTSWATYYVNTKVIFLKFSSLLLLFLSK